MLPTRLAKSFGFKISRTAAWVVGTAVLVLSVLGLKPFFDADSFRATWEAVGTNPVSLLLVIAAYFFAFGLRAAMWGRLLPKLSFGHALASIHLSIAGNHLLPLRLGEALRVSSAVKRASVGFKEALASTVTLRAADTLGLALLLAVLAPALVGPAATGPFVALVGVVSIVGAAGFMWMSRLRRTMAGRLRMPGLWMAVGATAAWLLESAVIWQACRWAGLEISATEAVLVTAATILSQVVALAPGGFGTYEAAATGALVALGASPGPALSAALAAHTIKTLYSLGAGAVGLFYPAPGLLGRLRLARKPARRRQAQPEPIVDPTRPIVLFLPALNEARNLPKVLGRLPEEVMGHPVKCLVVDDGSSDGTAAVARLGGARVVSHEVTQGLGAAVRTGLSEALKMGAVVVAFCDADTEYDPAELGVLARPILEGEADFVSGSRFAGGSRRMKAHRMLGNRVLSLLLSACARRWISDGQSGYRAFSSDAAAQAQVAHDYNYAQVLTLDLLAKGFVYAETPISYRFRTQGKSFVKLLPYLRAVVPSVYRQLNRCASPALVHTEMQPVAKASNCGDHNSKPPEPAPAKEVDRAAAGS